MKRFFAPILVALLLIGVSAVHAHAEPVAPTGSIAGTITDQVTGRPIVGVQIYACPRTGGACNTAFASASSDAAGSYRLSGLAEAEYKVCFIHDDYARECYDDWPYEGVGTVVKVGPDEAVTGIDAALAPAGLGRIRGRAVDSATGAGVPNALIALYGWILNREWYELRTTVTDEGGRFELNGLKGDTYRLRFGAEGYPTRFYRAGRTVEDAADVGVGTGQTVEGVEMTLATFGHIAGRVTNGAGAPLAAITVKVDDYWNPAGEAQTDALGRYDIGGLEEGEHRVEFRQAPIEYEPQPPHDYGPIWYSGAADYWHAKPVTVTLGKTTAGIDQVMPAVGSLRATFIDFYTGQPIPGVGISVFPNPDAWFHDATSDANGQVRIDSLDPGEYQVIVIGPEGTYDMLWPADAGPVVIRSGEVTEKQWILKGGPRIVRGRITDAATGAALAGISVNLLGSECHWRNGCHEYTMASIPTDADGRFEYVNPSPEAIGLAATDPKGVYDAAGVPYRYPERGETVVVEAALRTIASKYGEFAGRVTDANGGPLEGVTVTANRQDAAGQLSGRTGADGTYRFRAPAGAYLLTFSREGFYEATCTDPRTGEGGQTLWISAGEVTTADATLARGGGIEGTVRTEAGQPLQGAEVWVYAPCAQSWCEGTSHQTTAADGRYSYTLPDGVYRIKFEAGGRETLVWGGAATVEQGADITVAHGNYETINGTLRAGGVLEGRVTDRDTGLPVAGIRVIVGQWPVTDDDGRFVMGGLGTGAYAVQLTDLQSRYPRQYYDDDSGGPSPSTVQVTAGMTTTIAVTLQPPGRAAGRVTDAYGTPLAGIEVKVQQHCCYEWQAVTDANGQYTSPPLLNRDYYADDDYTVLFNDPQKHYQPEYADDSQAAHETRIMPGQVVTLDATLDRLPSVAGTVTDATGAPLAGVHVYVPGKWAPLKEVYTGGDSAYRLDDLPAGPTQLIFDTCCRRYLPVTRTVTLTVNTVTTGVDAQMQPWGVLKGRVTDEATGQPVAKAWVKLYRPVRDHWSLGTATVTGDDGSYAFYGLDSGTYRLEFAHPQGGYRSEAYPDAPNVAAGGDIAFVLEGDTEVDAALARQAAGVKVYVPLVAR